MKVLHEGQSETNGKGPIHAAQWLLAGHNVFKENYRPGKVDGRFSKQTSEACVRAKMALGYAEPCKPTFGDKLYAYLTGKKPLPSTYKARRTKRRTDRGQKFVYPAKKRAKLIGLPGGGTHSWASPPNNWQSDAAWDFAFPKGTPLVAVADGVIGNKIGPLSSDPKSRFGGLRCYLKTADNEFYYAHLSRFAPRTKPGAKVKQGQVIGYSGSASGVDHLHFACLDWRAYKDIAEG